MIDWGWVVLIAVASFYAGFEAAWRIAWARRFSSKSNGTGSKP